MPEHNTPPVVTEADSTITDEIVSAANITTCGSYYELDADAVAAIIANYRITSTEALIAENARLREALKPFAYAVFEADGFPDCEAFTLVLRADDEDGNAEPGDKPDSLITARQLRTAKAALETSHGG
jgi:hypothetical protein